MKLVKYKGVYTQRDIYPSDDVENALLVIDVIVHTLWDLQMSLDTLLMYIDFKFQNFSPSEVSDFILYGRHQYNKIKDNVRVIRRRGE